MPLRQLTTVLQAICPPSIDTSTFRCVLGAFQPCNSVRMSAVIDQPTVFAFSFSQDDTTVELLVLVPYQRHV